MSLIEGRDEKDNDELDQNLKRANNPSIGSPKEKAKDSIVRKERDSIHTVAERGNAEAVKELLRKKKSLVNARNEDGHTPIHIAALHNRYEVVDLLISNSADLLAKDNSGWSVLHFAASGRNEKILKLLLEQPNIDGIRKNIQLRYLLTFS